MAFSSWENLTYGIERGECILLLGPELPIIAEGGSRQLPIEVLQTTLLNRLSEERVSRYGIANANFARIAHHFLAQEDEIELELELQRWHEDLLTRVSPIHNAIAQIPFRLIVTCSFDPLLEAALQQAGKNPQAQHYHYRSSSPELLPEASVEDPVLFYLHGSVDDPTSVVATDLQLLDFLASVIGKDPPLPNDLNATLTNGRLFLFLGFGLQQWYLRILLHVLKVLQGKSRSFAFEDGKNHPHEAVADAILFYQQNFKLAIHDDDLLTFVKELQSRCESIVTANTPSANDGEATFQPLPAHGSKVFICHASDDAAHAQSIYDTLANAKLRPWLDKENLRGGDRWDDMIETTISEVDYFIVVNSRNLEKKAQGTSYVNKEIKSALRADDMRFSNFIIPVCVDDAPLLGPLTSFQAVDFCAADGPRTLVRAIKRHSSTA